MPKQDLDKSIAPTQRQSHNNGMKYVLVAVVSVLTTLGLVGGGLFIYQLLNSQQAIAPSNSHGNNTSVDPSSAPATVASGGIQPGQFVQPALGNKASVELTSVRRIPGVSDEVNVEMRISSNTANTSGGDVISVGSTTARNPINSETYQAVDFLKRSSRSVSLYQLRRGEPVEGYVVLKVPPGINTIDIYVPETAAFKNVPIAEANQTNSEANNSSVPESVNSSPTPSPTAPAELPPTATPAALVPNISTTIQPGQFVQPAFSNKAQVELLSVKRIKDPEVGTRDVVNVQFRVRRLAAETGYSDFISASQTTARNPETSETYKPVDFKRATSSIALYNIRRGTSVDAYVWLRIPEEVNTLDIYMEQTQAFNNVPISN